MYYNVKRNIRSILGGNQMKQTVDVADMISKLESLIEEMKKGHKKCS
jgi:hypothetical protein